MIGCGNLDAADDAVGILAVREARPSLAELPEIEVVDAASPLDVVHLLEGAAAVIVVDAIRTPGGIRSPGAVVRAEAVAGRLPSEIRSSLSSHGLGVAEAVGVGAAIGRSPVVVVLGIEADEVRAGEPLSAAVGEALPRLTEAIVAEAARLAGLVGAGPNAPSGAGRVAPAAGPGSDEDGRQETTGGRS